MRSAGTPAGRIPVDARFIYSNHKNVHTPAVERRQRGLLQKIAFICDFLDPRERVLLVVPCVSGLTRALVVFTDKGLFLIPTRLDLSFRHSVAKVRYADCRRLEVRPWGLLVAYASGQTERFFGVARAERLKLQAFLEEQSVGAAAELGAGKVQLCPRCTRALAPVVQLCPGCRLPFKDMATALRATVLIPGGGYFYVGRPALGVADALAQLVLLGLILAQFAGVAEGRAGATGNAVVFGILLVIQKLLALHHVRRCVSELIPKSKAVPPRQIAHA